MLFTYYIGIYFKKNTNDGLLFFFKSNFIYLRIRVLIINLNNNIRILYLLKNSKE